MRWLPPGKFAITANGEFSRRQPSHPSLQTPPDCNKPRLAGSEAALNPPTEVYYNPEVFAVMDEMVAAGKIRHYGVSVEKVVSTDTP
jgi:hypothetical protein